MPPNRRACFGDPHLEHLAIRPLAHADARGDFSRDVLVRPEHDDRARSGLGLDVDRDEEAFGVERGRSAATVWVRTVPGGRETKTCVTSVTES